MSTAESEQEQVRSEILDINGAAGYVTYIVDLWKGSRTDPATEIARYIGVWSGDALEKDDGEAFDPDWSPVMSGRYNPQPTPRPVLWQLLETPKKADRDAERFRDHQEHMLQSTENMYGTQRTKATLYQEFMNAIDTLANDPGDDAAWLAVDAYRNYEAQLHER